MAQPHFRVGTVLGMPTYAELADLIAVQRWELGQLDSVKACPAWAAKDPLGYGAWAGQVFDATAAMNAVLTDAQAQVDLIPEGLRAVTPVASPLFTKNAWQQVLDAAQPFHQLVATFTAKSGCTWPAGTPPQPTAPDFDLKVYQWTGKALEVASFGGAGLLILGLVLLFGLSRGSR
jgi:hypothetical protein